MFTPSHVNPSNARITQQLVLESPSEHNQHKNTAHKSYQIVKIFPNSARQTSSVMEELVFKCVVRVDVDNLSPESVKVEVMTNLKHLDNMQGEWHHIELPYRVAKDDEYHVYGQVLVLVEEGSYKYAFKSRTVCEKKGVLFPDDSYFSVVVKPIANLVIFADVLRVPYMSHIIGPIWVGNEWAGLQSKTNGFTHIMCLADELETPVEEGMCFCKASMVQGVKNPINKETFKRATLWIKRSLRDGYKILLYSKHGFGRAGSVMVGFVMMENPGLSFQKAFSSTFSRRPVLPHTNVKKLCEELFALPEAKSSESVVPAIKSFSQKPFEIFSKVSSKIPSKAASNAASETTSNTASKAVSKTVSKIAFKTTVEETSSSSKS